MTVTYDYIRAAYASSNITAPVPSGSGGMLIAIIPYRDSSPVPNTSADWTLIDNVATWVEASVKAYYSINPSPDMVFTRASGEAAIHVYRIDDANISTVNVKHGTSSPGDYADPQNLPDVSLAPNGVAISGIGIQANTGVASTSLSWNENYDGDIGVDTWWAQNFWTGHLNSVSPAGGTFDSGIWTSTSGGQLSNMITIVVETGGGSSTEPEQVTGLILSPGPNEISLSWSAPLSGGSPITDYLIEVSVDGGTTWSTISDGTNALTTYLHTGLIFGETYTYRVSAINAIGIGDPSSNQSETTVIIPPYFIGIGAVSNGTGEITTNLPASIITNDILIAFAESANQEISITNQNGGVWNSIAQGGTGTAAGTAATRIGIWWSRYNGSQGAITFGDSGDHTMARIMAIRGCPTDVDPIGIVSALNTNTGPTTYTFPSITTTVDQCLVVLAKSDNWDNTSSTRYTSWTNTNLSSLTERMDWGTTQGNGGGIGVATGIKTLSGSVGTTTVAQHASVTVDAAYTFALLPILPEIINAPLIALTGVLSAKNGTLSIMTATGPVLV